MKGLFRTTLFAFGLAASVPAMAAPGSAELLSLFRSACLERPVTVSSQVGMFQEYGFSRFGSGRNRDLGRNGGDPKGRFKLRSSDRTAVAEIGNLIGGGKSCALVAPLTANWDEIVQASISAVKAVGGGNVKVVQLAKSEYRLTYGSGRLFVRKSGRFNGPPNLHLTWKSR